MSTAVSRVAVAEPRYEPDTGAASDGSAGAPDDIVDIDRLSEIGLETQNRVTGVISKLRCLRVLEHQTGSSLDRFTAERVASPHDRAIRHAVPSTHHVGHSDLVTVQLRDQAHAQSELTDAYREDATHLAVEPDLVARRLDLVHRTERRLDAVVTGALRVRTCLWLAHYVNLFCRVFLLELHDSNPHSSRPSGSNRCFESPPDAHHGRGITDAWP